VSPRRALVTGGAGFIGSNIVAALVEDGWSVTVADTLGEAASGKWRNLAKHAIDDLIGPDDIFGWLDGRGSDVEAIVHMGAVSSTTEPDADLILRANFGLSRDLWAWAADHGRRLIYASSAATYGDGGAGFADRDDPASLKALRPLNPYGWSKALFDLHAARSAAAGRAPAQWAGLKFFNVYGPNDLHKGGMRSVVTQKWVDVATGREVVLFKSHREGIPHGGQMRDFVHVQDAVEVVRWLLDQPAVNGIYNLGTGQARSFADLARAMFKAAELPERIDYIEMPAEIRDQYQYFTQAEMGRLRAAGYARPFLSLEDGVADYVGRFLSQPDPYR
jgi:ADP-L-glycero-D-manno-heptose 6-epimerase